MGRGLSFETEEATLKKDFEECGEIVRCKMPLNDEGKCKGIAFIEFKTKDGFDAALKFNEDTYGGRTIYVSKAGEGKGDGKKGKDKSKGKDKGKGKDGKDGKGKGKGKKGKKDGLSTEAKASKNGSMVESTGTKQTFGDSDDE